MAEKYGTVPKKFTRAWWEHFWMYYKWHTIVIIGVILLTLLTIHQVKSIPKYDLTLTYGGKYFFSDEAVAKIEDTLSPLIPDIDENGKKSLRFLQITLPDDTSSNAEYAQLTQAKLMLSIAEDEAYIYILDKETALGYTGMGAFAPLEDWLECEVSREDILSDDGTDFAVSLSACGIFRELGAELNDHYLFIRYYPREDQKEKQLTGYNTAIELANTIFSQ